MAVELACSGQEVCVIARGAHLQAIQERGLRLVARGGEKVATGGRGEDPGAFGLQDFVICALKAHQAYQCARHSHRCWVRDRRAHGDERHSLVVFLQDAAAASRGIDSKSVDPRGAPVGCDSSPQRAIGCVVEPACEVVAPGVVVHHELNRFIDRRARWQPIRPGAGALPGAHRGGIRRAGARQYPLEHMAQAMGQCLLQSHQRAHRRDAGPHRRRPALLELCKTMMLEAKAVNEALGYRDSRGDDRASARARGHGRQPQNVDAAGPGARPVARNRCSGDRRSGARPPRGRFDPPIDAVLALVQERGRTAGLYTAPEDDR